MTDAVKTPLRMTARALRHDVGLNHEVVSTSCTR